MGVLLALGHGEGLPHQSVAPWDVPDAPAPRRAPLRGRRVEAPPGMVHAEGSRITLPSGVSVEFLAISRRPWDRSNLSSPLPDARPAWEIDGSPFLRRTPERYVSWTPFGDPDEKLFDDHGTRYLTFRFRGTVDAQLDVYGAVPETARQGDPHSELHGRTASGSIVLDEKGKADLQATLLPTDREARHFRLAVASGEWKRIAEIPLNLDPPEKAMLSDGPTGRIPLVKGTWGTLWQDAKEIDALRNVFGYSGPGPSVRYEIEAPEPRRVATRLRFVYPDGKSEIANKLAAWGVPYPVRVEIETRPYEWVEFSDVHYDPDPKKWLPAYWGAEGEPAVARNGTTALRSIVQAAEEEGSLVAQHVYAPDGTLWRASPGSAIARFGGSVSPQTRGKWFALLGLPTETPTYAVAQVFRAYRAVPGKGLGVPLTAPEEISLALPQIAFTLPPTPYVQVAVQYSLPWRKIGEVAAPRPDEVERFERRYAQGAASFVSVFADGYAAKFAPDPYSRLERVFRWTVRHPGTRARIVLRTRMGERQVVNEIAIPGLFYAKSGGPWFAPNGQGEYVYRASETSPEIRLRDIAAFEIETQDFTDPVYVAAKLPHS